MKVHSLKLSDIRGWSMYCEDAVSMLALHVPEEERCMDILELIEHEKFLRYTDVLFRISSPHNTLVKNAQL